MALLTHCRTCLAEAPDMFLAMGDHPPANSFVRSEDVAKHQPVYPLDTQVCLECGLIQVADQVPADFFEHYLYVPSSASSMHSHFAELADILTTGSGLRSDRRHRVQRRPASVGLQQARRAHDRRRSRRQPRRNRRHRGVSVDVGYFTSARAPSLRREIRPCARDRHDKHVQPYRRPP